MSRRDESGAIAVVVAVLSVFLIGMLTFVADFGMAYANKRQTQTAADAAALGAAGVYSAQSGTCATMKLNGDGPAQAEAVTKVDQNDDNMPNPGVLAEYSSTCTPDGLVVETKATTVSPSFFGGLFGGGDYALDRSAAAIVEASSTVGAGLRPLALCSRDLIPLTTFPTPVMKFTGPGTGSGAPSDCPGSAPGGNWWTLNCPEDASNGDLADNISQGCEAPVTIVPGQPAPSDPGLGAHLLDYCDPASAHRESCLTNNPGNVQDINSGNALESLVTSGETIYFPVFCGTPTCNPGAVSTDAGGNTVYPVFRLIAAQLCGYHLGNVRRFPAAGAMTGDCANNPLGFDPMENDNGTNYLLLSIQQMQVSGGTSPSTCPVGAPCDTGLRQVRMVAPSP